MIAGRLAADAEVRTFESGATLTRLLVTVRNEEPRHRIDVIPVVMWDADIGDIETWKRGEAVWIAGAVQRRFWNESESGRTSRIEVVAHEIALKPQEVKINE